MLTAAVFNIQDFLIEFLKACKQQGFSTAVDTSGYVSEDVFRRVLPYADLLLYDLKHIDDQEHGKLTGRGNDLILKDLKIPLKFPPLF